MPNTYRFFARPTTADGTLWELYVDLLVALDPVPRPQLVSKGVAILPEYQTLRDQLALSEPSAALELYTLPGASSTHAQAFATNHGGTYLTSGAAFDAANAYLP